VQRFDLDRSRDAQSKGWAVTGSRSRRPDELTGSRSTRAARCTRVQPLARRDRLLPGDPLFFVSYRRAALCSAASTALSVDMDLVGGAEGFGPRSFPWARPAAFEYDAAHALPPSRYPIPRQSIRRRRPRRYPRRFARGSRQRKRLHPSRSREAAEVGQLCGCSSSAGVGPSSKSARREAPSTKRERHHLNGPADRGACHQAPEGDPRRAGAEGPGNREESLDEAARHGSGVQEDQEDRATLYFPAR
jgi:hypothetical protein